MPIILWDEDSKYKEGGGFVKKIIKSYNLSIAKNKKIVSEGCPKCRRLKMCHYNTPIAHWRECTYGGCDYVEKLELWELTCSCGKEPVKKSPNVHYTTKCANYVPPDIPPGAVLI